MEFPRSGATADELASAFNRRSATRDFGWRRPGTDVPGYLPQIATRLVPPSARAELPVREHETTAAYAAVSAVAIGCALLLHRVRLARA